MAYSVISDSGFSFDLATFGFARQELGPTILDTLYSNTYEIGLKINDRIRARTAVWTGALQSDEVFVANEDYKNTGDPMVNFYAEDTNQIGAWGRTYGRFIEGPDLGYTSPTIRNPSHMYARVETDDMDLLDEWALTYLEAGTERLAVNEGIIGS